MANSGGSINLRMSLQGAEQVKAELASIGPAGSRMARELDRAMRQPAPGLKALDAGAKEVRSGVEGLASGLGPLGAGLSALGGIGLGVAAALAAVSIGVAGALGQARAATEWADALEDSAAKINIGVEALQEWRFAAVEAGGAASDADAAIDSFQKKLGEAMAGGRAAKWFERLGFGGDDLKAFASTEAALDETIRRIAALGTEAERAAVSEKLGLGPLIPLIRSGSDAIDEMRQRARDLGVVMDEAMVRRGAEANREMEILSQVIDLQLKQAFIDLAPVLLETLKIVGWVAEGIRDVAEAWKALDQRSTAGLRDEYDRHQAVITRMLSRPGVSSPDDLDPMSRRQFNQSNTRMGEITGALARRAATREPAPRPDGNSLVDLSSGPRASAGNREAERRAREAERAEEQLAQLEKRQRRDMGNVYTADNTIEMRRARAELDIQADSDERAAVLENLRLTLEKGDRLSAENQARLDALQLTNTELDHQRRALADIEQNEARAREVAEAEQAYVDITADILSLASSGARTAEERRVVELRLLEIAQDRQRAELENLIATTEAGEAQQRYIAALNLLPELHARQREAVNRQHAGPLGQWRDSQLQGLGEIGEHLQGEALDALDSLNEGLRDAWKNAENAGDAFKAMADVAVDALGRVVDALMEVAIQRLLIEPLANGIFGGSGPAGGGFLGSFLSNFMGGGGLSPKPAGGVVTVTGSKGFARGGLVGATGLYPVGEEQMELVELPGGARVHDAHRTNAILAGTDSRLRGGGATVVAPVVDMQVNVINKASDQVSARATQTPKGLDLIVEPLVRSAVGKMGADGSLARAQAMTPRPIRRG